MNNRNGSELFSDRHIGLDSAAERQMLNTLGFGDIDSFLAKAIPPGIRQSQPLEFGAAISESKMMDKVRSIILDSETAAPNSSGCDCRIPGGIAFARNESISPKPSVFNICRSAAESRPMWRSLKS